RNAKQGRQVEKNRLGNEDGANGLIFQRLLSCTDKLTLGLSMEKALVPFVHTTEFRIAGNA
ncbi:hypothetical protein, partial [Pseudomonas coronafaciens]|uniref:hypothetical protein n=1 Tax=Pseudomonas coronafaciens TaxID=53409 RepID=UPI001C12107F